MVGWSGEIAVAKRVERRGVSWVGRMAAKRAGGMAEKTGDELAQVSN